MSTKLSAEDERLLREAEARHAEKRLAFEQAQPKPLDGPAEPVMTTREKLDPENWLRAICPTCPGEDAEHRVPHIVAKVSGQPARDGISVLCGECRDKADRERKESEDAELLESRRRNPEPLLRAAGVPYEYLEMTRPRWEEKYGRWENHWQRELIGWPESRRIRGGRQVVVLHGLYGRRKTGLGVAILGEAAARGLSCRWEDTALWLEDLKSGGFSNREQVWDRVKRPDVVQMDDFAAVLGGRVKSQKSDTSWAFEQMALLSRYRRMNGKPTIYTMNLKSISALSVIDPSLPSRFDVPLKFEMEGPDYRSGRP